MCLDRKTYPCTVSVDRKTNHAYTHCMIVDVEYVPTRRAQCTRAWIERQLVYIDWIERQLVHVAGYKDSWYTKLDRKTTCVRMEWIERHLRACEVDRKILHAHQVDRKTDKVYTAWIEGQIHAYTRLYEC